MPNPPVLSVEAMAEALAQLSGWDGDVHQIRRTVECTSFPAAIAVVDAVALAAEAADHHPDIDIRWRTLHFALSTHVSGGVTQRDIALAKEIDSLVSELSAAAGTD